MRIFGGDQVAKIMGFLKIPEDEPIEHGMVTRAIEQAQVKVEGFNFDARKHVVDYDDVMNKQREIVYGLRNKVLNNQITDAEILEKIQSQLTNTVKIYAPRGIVESEVLPITTALLDVVPFDDVSARAISEQFKKLGLAAEIISLIKQIVADSYAQRKTQVGDSVWSEIIRFAYLSSIDNLWVAHLDAIDDLREGIGLRGYGQRDPLIEYKGEAFAMFERLLAQINSEFARRLFRIQVGNQVQAPSSKSQIPNKVQVPEINETRKPTDFLSAMQGLQKGGVQNTHKNLGRNDPCWCNSGKKYKKCHLNR
jgi:preprotein translocase subunit SecA